MGFLDSITDIFTGRPQREAAERARAYTLDTQNRLIAGNDAAAAQAGDSLRAGYRDAAGNLTRGYGASADAIRAGAGDALGYLDSGALGALGKFAQARGDVTAHDAYRPLGELAADFRSGARLHADALGINGPEGRARAEESFKAGPGYRFTLEQGLDAINRRRNAGGMLASGAADVDAVKFGSGLADQTYQQWLAGLQPYNNLTLGATQGAASGAADTGRTLANLGVGEAALLGEAGKMKSAIATGQGTSLADIANRYYAGLAGLDTAQGGALAGNASGNAAANQGAMLNLTPQVTASYRQEGDAAMQGSKNLWGLGMSLANLGASALGGFGGPGAIFRSAQGGPTYGPTYANGSIGAFGGVPFPIIGRP
jgi:hypothetical protein